MCDKNLETIIKKHSDDKVLVKINAGDLALVSSNLAYSKAVTYGFIVGFISSKSLCSGDQLHIAENCNINKSSCQKIRKHTQTAN